MVALEFLLIYQHPGLPPGLFEPRLSVLATFLPCWDKIPEQKQLEDMFILLPSLRGNEVHCEGRERHIISSGPSCGNRAYGNGDTAFRVRKQKRKAGAQFTLTPLPPSSPGPSHSTVVLRHTPRVSSFCRNILIDIWRRFHGDSKSVKLTMMINCHILSEIL